MICLNCGRRLKSAASREKGYGPVCYKKLFGDSPRSNRERNISKNADGPDNDHELPGQIAMDDYLRKLSME